MTNFVGNTAEWIIEAPSVKVGGSTIQTDLANYFLAGWSSLNASVTNSTGMANYKPSTPATGTSFSVTVQQNGGAVSKPK
jgi:hypothetical protein